MESKPAHIVIVGGGTAGWMAANLLAHQWHKLGIRISLVESSRIATVGVGEGSTPFLKEFFELLGIRESEWMPACNATYKCGIRFPGWSTHAGYQSYVHPFYSDLDGERANAFFRLCNARRSGEAIYAHPDDFFLASTLTRQSRAPVSDTIPPQELVYAYHFDAELLGQFLRQHALKLGVQHIDDKVEHVLQQENGDIGGLKLQRSGLLRGDFFVDCSGFNALLIQQTLGEQIQSYRQYLFNDRAVALPSPRPDANTLPPETVSQALTHGWMWQIPLKNRYGNGYVYCSDYLSDEQAEQQLRTALNLKDDDSRARFLGWQPGRITHHWKQNCLAIGLSQGFLEPLEAPMLYIVQKSIESFIDSASKGGFSARYREQYNQQINRIIDGTRDYLQAHYLLNSRTDTAYWQDNRENTCISPALQRILDAWNKREHFDQVLHELGDQLAYLKTSWYCLLAGKGCFKHGINPLRAEASQHAHQQTLLQAQSFRDHHATLCAMAGSQAIAS